MNEIETIIETLQLQRGLDKETVVKVIFKVLSESTRSLYPEYKNPTAIFKENEGFQIKASFIVKDIVEDPFSEIALAEAKKAVPSAKIGDVIDVEINDKDKSTRIGAKRVKQDILYALSNLEKEKKLENYKSRIGTIMQGHVVEHSKNGNIVIEFSDTEGILPRNERSYQERPPIGSPIYVLLKEISSDGMKTDLICSRADNEFIRQLFIREIEEIRNEFVEIKTIAREIGVRTKVSVHSKDLKINPTSACIGVRGSRIKHIVRELNREKVDVVLWDSNVQAFAKNAFAPLEPIEIVQDDENKTLYISFNPEDHPLAIGKKGVNIRLISQLIGYEINIEKNEQAKQNDAENSMSLSQFGLDDDAIQKLTEEKILSPKEFASSKIEELEKITGLNQESLASIIDRINEKLS